MDTKHTPGPWTVDERASTRVRDSADTTIASAGMASRTLEEAQVNAHLIAAAPELLDSLWKLANEASGFLAMADKQTHGNTNMAILRMRIDDAKAVIAKAEGKS